MLWLWGAAGRVYGFGLDEVRKMVRQYCDTARVMNLAKLSTLDYAYADSIVDFVEAEAARSGCVDLQIIAYRWRAFQLHSAGRMDELERVEQASLDWVERARVGGVKVWLYLGYAERTRHFVQMAKARAYYEKALAISRQYGLYLVEIDLLARLSVFHEREGLEAERDFGKAVGYAMQAIELVERCRQKGLLRGAEEAYYVQSPLLRMCEAFYHAGMYAEADKLATAALRIPSPQTGPAMIHAWTMAGLIARQQGRYDAAFSAFQKTLDIATKNGNFCWVGVTLGNIGSVCLLRQDYASAISYYTRNMEYSTRCHDLNDLTLSHIRLCRAYMGLQQPAKAQAHIEEARTRIIRHTALYIQRELYETASDFYRQIGQHRQAYEDQCRLLSLKDSLQKKQIIDQLAETQTRLSLREKENQLALLEKENLLREQARQLERVWLSVACMVTVGAVCAAIFLFRLGRERKLRQQLLVRQSAALQQANRTKDRLFSIIAHDLRSPLNSLQGILSLVTQYDMSREELQQIFHSLSQAIEGTTASLDNLLTWSRAQMRVSRTMPEAVHLPELLEGEMQLLRAVAGQKQIRLSLHGQEVLYAWVDAGQLRVVCRNLIANALKFTPSGGSVSVHLHALSAETVEISVRDTGLGMDEETRQRLFDRQEVLSTRGTAGEKGTGLGLMLCREFLEANGSSLQVQSRLGEGTVFSFVLKQCAAPQQTRSYLHAS